MNSGSLRVWERLPPSKNSYVILSLLHWIQLRKLTNVYHELCSLQHTMRRVNYQKSRRLFVSVDWHEREPGFPRTASSCALFAVSERSGGRWSFYGNNKRSNQEKKEKTFRYNIWRKGNFTQTSQKTTTHKNILYFRVLSLTFCNA